MVDNCKHKARIYYCTILIAFCEHKTSNHKSFQKTVGIDRSTLIEQSGIRKIGLISDSGNRNLINLWSIIGHNGA